MSLERGSTRSRPNTPSSVTAIAEKDESLPDADEDEHLLQQEDHPKQDVVCKHDTVGKHDAQSKYDIQSKHEIHVRVSK